MQSPSVVAKKLSCQLKIKLRWLKEGVKSPLCFTDSSRAKNPAGDRCFFSQVNFAGSRRIATTLEPYYLKNWRPITLLNCDYKIAAKAIANRLRNVPKIINNDQTGFLKGRFIGENIRLLDGINFKSHWVQQYSQLIIVFRLWKSLWHSGMAFYLENTRII